LRNSGDTILYFQEGAGGKFPCATQLDFPDILFIPGILAKCGQCHDSFTSDNPEAPQRCCGFPSSSWWVTKPHHSGPELRSDRPRKSQSTLGRFPRLPHLPQNASRESLFLSSVRARMYWRTCSNSKPTLDICTPEPKDAPRRNCAPSRQIAEPRQWRSSLSEIHSPRPLGALGKSCPPPEVEV
jgi:hypothetical protein